jgi:8-oxo-dGTP pyrophosphatase MutT (NUDIX family)
MVPVEGSASTGSPVEHDAREVRVAAYALCQRDGRLLLVRASALTEIAGWWFLPGGGLEFGEEPVDAVLRELVEETGLRGSNPVLLGVLSDVRRRRSGRKVQTVRVVFSVSVPGGDLVSEMHGTSDEARWVPLGELEHYDLAPYVVRAIDAYAEK